MSGTPGVVLVQVTDGAAARIVCEKLAGGPTYFRDHDGALHVYADNAESWFHRVAVTMSLNEFFDRFVSPKQEPAKMSIASKLTSAGTAVVSALSFAPDDDPDKATRESLPSLADVRRAEENAAAAAKATADAVASGMRLELARERFGEHARALATDLMNIKQRNDERRNYGPPVLVENKRIAVEGFMFAMEKRNGIIERLRANHERATGLKSAVASSKVNIANAGPTSRASVEGELKGNQEQLDAWQREKCRLLADLARNEISVRETYAARLAVDDQLSDRCGAPRRLHGRVEGFLETPSWLKTDELATA